MKKLRYILGAFLLAVTSCVSLDIPPKNIVTDDDLLTTQSGVSIYLARLYSKMPWEDFKYIPWNGGFNGQTWLGCLGVEGTGEAVCREGGAGSFTSESTAWWGLAYVLIHDANHFLETLPAFKDNLSFVPYTPFR